MLILKDTFRKQGCQPDQPDIRHRISLAFLLTYRLGRTRSKAGKNQMDKSRCLWIDVIDINRYNTAIYILLPDTPKVPLGNTLISN
jgi:hypothetical protein